MRFPRLRFWRRWWASVDTRLSRKSPLKGPEPLESREVPSAAVIKDVNVTNAGSSPTALVSMGGADYFVATDSGEAWLFRTDGTAANTVRLDARVVALDSATLGRT